MMKKLRSLLFLLILVACGNSRSGGSYTTCDNVLVGLVADDVGETVITVEGYDDEVLLWTISTTLTRAEFNEAFLQGTYLSNDEIHELFEYYSEREMEGISLYIAELTNEHVVIAKSYDYIVIDNDELSRIWGVDNFENTVTLSAAIASLEDQDAMCETVAIEDENEEEDEID